MKRALIVLAVAVAAWSSWAAAAPVRVVVASGALVGEETGGVSSFKGVPFAAPPIGPLRWAPPAPALSWPQDRPAVAYGPACPQVMRKDGGPNFGGASGPVSEDCLTLNVFAPTGARGAPVMVWIYGGGNTLGSNSVSAYDGSAFARDGVILVSVNYRLGALGFFAHPSLTKAAAPGAPLANYALMDQIAALRWVQRNIAAFGGDPAKVTLFGESAGGVDTLALMSAPSARGLFARAIVESGGGWSEPVSLAAAEAAGQGLAAKASLPPNASLEALRAIPAEALAALPGRFGPIVDGGLLRESPTQAFAAGRAAPTPLIIGSNSFEASLLAASGAPPEAYLAMQPAGLLAAYADETSPKAKAYAMFTDGVMGAPARWIAALQSRHSKAWLYYFSYRRAAYESLYPGAPHATEIPFVFDSWDKIDPRLSRGPETPDDAALTRIVHACWTAFAKTGTPDCPTPASWPAYSPGSDQLMAFGAQVERLTHFRKPQLDAQQKAKAALLSPP